MAITAEAWNSARTRVLTRYAEQAEREAVHYRQRVEGFPDAADELRRVAAGLDRYAERCRAAADDPTLADTGVRRQQRRTVGDIANHPFEGRREVPDIAYPC